MKKLTVLFLTMLCLAGCGEVKVENPDILKTAVITTAKSVTAKNTLAGLNESTVATLTAQKINGKGSLSKYDVVYIDKSAIELDSFNPKVVQEYVNSGGCVFLDNEVYGLFDPEFIGASEFVEVGACPVDMIYPDVKDKSLQKIQKLIGDFCGLYKNYFNYENTLSRQYYGVGVVPSTAQCIAERNGIGIYTVNQYGNGYVFFTNPLLPNSFSVNNLSKEDTGEASAMTTVSASKLLHDYFAEFASLKKYGYAIERVFGSFASPAASWVIPIDTVTSDSAEVFNNMCRIYGQIPSYTMYIKSRCAGNVISVPFYLNNGLSMLHLPNIPYGNSYYSDFSAQYGIPLIFYNNLSDASAQEDIVRRADNIAEDYGYNFAMENQLAKMTAAAYNTFVNAKWENDGLSLSAECKDTEKPLYDKNYQSSVGVKIILADGVSPDEFGIDASVYYKKDNCIYVSLDKGARISKHSEHNKINITSVNLPARISKTEDSATVKFLDGGMMSVTVRGTVKTTSDGWETTMQEGKTVFTKYGEAQTLKIER